MTQNQQDFERSVSGITMPARVGLRARARRWLYIGWCRAVVSMKSGRWWLGNAIMLAFWVALGWPVYQKNVGQGIAHTLFAILVLAGRAWRYSSPASIQLVQREYLKRKLLLYKLIKDVQRRDDLSETERLRFQCETLQLIVSYVRGHRADTAGTQIYANLLVEDGEELVVIARDSNHRFPAARYPKAGMYAWEVFQTGAARVVGDLRREKPDAVKPYRSILSLPVRGPDGIVAVVSIDSARPYHFDLEHGDLERYVSPYLALLEWSLILSVTMRQPSAVETGSIDNGQL